MWSIISISMMLGEGAYSQVSCSHAQRPVIRLSSLQRQLDESPLQFSRQLRTEMKKIKNFRQSIPKNSHLGRIFQNIVRQVLTDFSKLISRPEAEKLKSLLEKEDLTLKDFADVEIIFVKVSSLEVRSKYVISKDFFSSFSSFFEASEVGVFILPMNLETPIEKLNALWSHGIAPIGLIRGEAFTDGYETNAQGFQQHDQTHASVFILAIENAIQKGLTPDQIFESSIGFFEKMLHLGQKTSSQTHRVLQELYFVEAHEIAQEPILNSRSILFSHMRSIIGFMRKKESISSHEVIHFKREIAQKIIEFYSNKNRKTAHPEFYLTQNPDLQSVIEAVEILAMLIDGT